MADEAVLAVQNWLNKTTQVFRDLNQHLQMDILVGRLSSGY